MGERRQWQLLGNVKTEDMSGANEDEPVSAPDRQLNRQKDVRDRMGWWEEERIGESVIVSVAGSGYWVSLWNNQD